jgi:methylamine utilization protein MauJ
VSSYTQNLPWSLGPYDWLPASAPQTVTASDADAVVRPVGVTIFLEDPRARAAQVYVRPPAQTEYHVTTDEGAVVDLWLRATPDGQFLSSVLLGTHAPSPKQAFDRSYAYLLSLISLWSFQAQRPMAVREILVDDRPHGAKWIVRPQAQVPLKLNDLKGSFGVAHPLGSLMALFREGMASTQASQRFLSYYKILDAWKKGAGPFKLTNEQLTAKGIKRRRLVFEEAMFMNKPATHDYSEVLGKKFTWCIDRMNEARKFVAHPFDEQGQFLSLDDPMTQAALSQAANMAERMAIEILVEELKLLRSLAPSDEAGNRVLEAYIHESWGKDLLPKGAGKPEAPT